MSSIDTVSLRWQRNISDEKKLLDSGWCIAGRTLLDGRIDKLANNATGTNLPRLTWSQHYDREGWLTAEFSAPYLIHGTNALDADNLDIAVTLDAVSDYVASKTGVDCDSRKALVGRVDYAANFAVGADIIPLYLEAALEAKVSRLKPPRRESGTSVCVDGSNRRKIQLYDKHADVLDKIEKGRLEGKFADIARETSLGVLRLESRFTTTQLVKRLAKALDIERTPESMLTCETADKVIAMELKKLSLDKPVESESARLDSLIETFGSKAADFYGFLALRDRFGDEFYRFEHLGISKAKYYRKVRELKAAGLWLSVASERPLSALSEVPQVRHRKAA